MRRFFAPLGLFLCSTTVQAALDDKLQYDYVQINYYRFNAGEDIQGHGVGVEGSIPFLKRNRSPFYVMLRFRIPEHDYADATGEANRMSMRGGEVGIGWHDSVTESMDWSVTALMHNRDYDEYVEKDERDHGDGDVRFGGGLHLGVRQLVMPSFEWGAEVASVYFHGNELHRHAYVQWHLNTVVSVGARIGRMEREELSNIFVRLSF